MTRNEFPIGVGMPVYNGQKYLREAVDSILGQTFSDFELLISDNASTDATRDICEEYSGRDSRIRYVRQDVNIGGSRNWNFVAESSRGKYFKWASANDVCHPEMLARCKEILDLRPDVVLCYPRTRMIDDAGAVIEDYVDSLHLQEESPCERFVNLLLRIQWNNAQNGLIRKDILRRTALEGIYTGGDIPLMAELALYGKYYEIPDCLFYRRMSADTASVLLTPAELRRFINPASRNRVHIPTWKMCADLVRAVHRSPVPAWKKLGLDGFLIKFAYWNRGLLWDELTTVKNLLKTG
jgi:glycosyltransferase involved in cell wall biosynthesis